MMYTQLRRPWVANVVLKSGAANGYITYILNYTNQLIFQGIEGWP